MKGQVDFEVRPQFATEPVLSVNVWVFLAITSDLPRKLLPKNIKERFSNFTLADPYLNVSSPVDLLLGADLYPSIVDGRKVTIVSDLPTVFHTIFGWVLIGPVFFFSLASSIISCFSIGVHRNHDGKVLTHRRTRLGAAVIS